MKIGFIGTGNMGGALARAAAKGGHTLLLANRTPAKAEALAVRPLPPLPRQRRWQRSWAGRSARTRRLRKRPSCCSSA